MKLALSMWEKYQEQLEETNGARMEADEYLEERARSPSAANRIFLQKYSLKLQMISKQNVSSDHVNHLTYLTSISIHRSRFLRLGQVARTRIASRTRQQRPRRGGASVIDAVTINLHASTVKFGLIAKTPMIWYSEISSHMLSNRTETALARLSKRTDFTSKRAKNQGKWCKTRETSQ